MAFRALSVWTPSEVKKKTELDVAVEMHLCLYCWGINIWNWQKSDTSLTKVSAGASSPIYTSTISLLLFVIIIVTNLCFLIFLIIMCQFLANYHKSPEDPNANRTSAEICENYILIWGQCSATRGQSHAAFTQQHIWNRLLSAVFLHPNSGAVTWPVRKKFLYFFLQPHK